MTPPEQVEPLNSGGRSRWQVLALLALGTVVLAAYSSFGRPLWIDEFVHFALGGLPPQEALTALYRTLGPSLSHGQTGVYMLYDYAVLRAAGTNLFLFRLPSLVSGALLLVAAVHLVRVRGLGFPWQVLVLLSLSAQSWLMFHAGNARPYSVLAASVVCTLAYYETDAEGRRRWLGRLLGSFGILVGAVFHPYFAPMLLAVLAFSVWRSWFDGGPRPTVRSVIAYANPWLVVPAAVLYLLVGSLSWLRGVPEFDDPRPTPLGLVRQLASSHLGMLFPNATEAPPRLLLVGLAAIATALALVGWLGRGRAVVPPVVLMGLGLATTAGVSALSVVKHYEVFDRQWVVGMALVAIGLPWFLGAAWGPMRKRHQRVGTLVIVALVAAIALTGVRAAWIQLAAIPVWLHNWQTVAEQVVPGEDVLRPHGLDNGGWVRLANDNVSVGGSVWPSVGTYYSGRPE